MLTFNTSGIISLLSVILALPASYQHLEGEGTRSLHHSGQSLVQGGLRPGYESVLPSTHSAAAQERYLTVHPRATQSTCTCLFSVGTLQRIPFHITGMGISTHCTHWELQPALCVQNDSRQAVWLCLNPRFISQHLINSFYPHILTCNGSVL